jgi:hypothetical protein
VLPELISAYEADGRARHGVASGAGGRTELHARPQGGAVLVAEVVTPETTVPVAASQAVPRSLALLIVLGAIALGVVAAVQWWRRRWGDGYEFSFLRRR